MQSQLVVKYWCSLDPAWTRHFFRWTTNTSGYSKNCIETCLKGQVNVPICLHKTWRLSCLVPRRHSRVVRVSHSPVCENRSGWGRLRQVTEYYLSRSCITNGGITNTGSGSNTRVKVVSKTAWKQKQKRKNKTRHNKKRWLNRCLFVRSVLLSWLSKERRAKLAWGNSRHLATLLLVSHEMTSEKRVQKFHTDNASLPRSGWCLWLVVPRGKFSSTNQ